MREYGIKRKKGGVMEESEKSLLAASNWSEAELSEEGGSNSSFNTSFDHNTPSTSSTGQDLTISKTLISQDAGKDPKYFERRKRNNMAAKKSRDARKVREDMILAKVAHLEKENSTLKAQAAMLREEANILQACLLQKRQSESSNTNNILVDQQRSSFSPGAPPSIPSDLMNLQLPLPLQLPLTLPLQQLSQLQLQLPVNYPFGPSLNIQSPLLSEVSNQPDVQLTMLLALLNQYIKK